MLPGNGGPGAARATERYWSLRLIVRFRSDASRDRSLDRPVVDVVDEPSVRSTRQRDVHWWTEDVEDRGRIYLDALTLLSSNLCYTKA